VVVGLVFVVVLFVWASKHPCEARAANPPGTTRNTAAVRPIEDCEAAARAKLAAGNLAVGNYERVWRDFDAMLQGEVSVAALSRSWQESTQASGRLLDRRVTSVCARAQAKEARVEMFFLSTRVNVVFTFGPDRRIVAFSILERDFMTAPLPEEPLACRP
jgi:hypothetical protein